MTNDSVLDTRQRRFMAIVIAYPIVIFIVSIVVNLFVFGVSSYVPAMPSFDVLYVLAITAVLLAANHTWIITATELTRVRFRMFATPEEWAASGSKKENSPTAGVTELERVHNTHRNTTENTVYFALLVLPFIVSTPTLSAAKIWLLGFAVARLGYTYSYFKGKDNIRGLFMTLGLLAMYGIASYLLLSFIM